MQNTMQEEQVSKVASINGISVYQVKSAKFKTNSINIFFIDSLSKENATKNALLPAVLRRGCQRFPSFQNIALYLEELYGASFDCGVAKKGECQIIQFYIDHISDKYAQKEGGLFEKSFDLLYEIIMEPALENGIFKEEYIEREKENLKKLIESRVNDKLQYSVERCFEEMCKDEPFGVYEYGTVSDLDSINGKGLYEYYTYVLQNLPMQVFISGDMEEDKIRWVVERLSQIKRGQVKGIDAGAVRQQSGEVRNVTERMNVSQGKLSLGFRTNTAPKDEDYYKLMVYNGILGGGIHSKLFQNVREKESLAYYVFSRMEKFKGLMIISGGIEIKNRDKAVDIILRQMDEIKEGNISDYEYESTLKTIETGIRSLRDSQLQIVDFYLGQTILNAEETFESIIERIKKVSMQEVVDVSKRIKLDTIYFLTGNSAE